MKYGKALKEKGTIGFVAPAFGCATEPYKSCFENALRIFTEDGYKVDLGPNCFLAEGIGISNDPRLCGEELSKNYMSKSNDVLISCGGGELMCEILDYVDWKGIKKSPPKRFMGFSDNTHFTYLLTTICDVASIYGPCAPGFGMEPWHKSILDGFKLISTTKKSITLHGYPSWESESLKSEEDPFAPYNLNEKKILKYFSSSLIKRDTTLPSDVILEGNQIPEISFAGRLIGGCMDCLGNILGTRYDHTEEFLEKYKNDGFIWYMEACDLNVFDIRRTIWQMDHAGWFKGLRGFIFGRPYSGMDDMMGLNRFDAVLSVISKYDVPVIMDADLGHFPPSMPLVNGSYAFVKVKKNRFSIRMEMRE